MKYKCNRDCFNCIFEDCIVSESEISKEEREAIRERDKQIFTTIPTRVVRVRPGRVKNRNKMMVLT